LILKVEKDQWVRVKAGNYRGDLGRIVRLEDRFVIVELVPRLKIDRYGNDIKHKNKK